MMGGHPQNSEDDVDNYGNQSTNQYSGPGAGMKRQMYQADDNMRMKR